jgi:mRNA interferase MazF
MPRRQLYAVALHYYLQEHRSKDITERLDEVYGTGSEELHPSIARLQERSLAKDEWVIRRGEVWWAGLPEPVASRSGYRRLVLIVQSDDFNGSRIRTVVAAALTTKLRLAAAPGNVSVVAGESGLPRDSVVNVSRIITLDKTFLTERAGRVSGRTMLAVEDGMRMVLAL